MLGALAHRLRLPPLVGYIAAGVIVGPHTPGFVADQGLAAQLADIGVVLLMFGVGLQFSPRDLARVRSLAVPGTILQIALATPLGTALGLALGWPLSGATLFGFSLTIASTVVLLKALQDRRLVETERGRLTIGWAVAEDLTTVVALVLIPALAAVAGGTDRGSPLLLRVFGDDFGVAGALAVTGAQIAAFAATMLVIGRRAIPAMLHWVAHLGSRELFRLAVLAIALGAALASAKLFGVSLAIGAFFAGMILAESELSQRAAQETLPLRDAFAVLFFVSVGMLFNPAIIISDPLALVAVVFIVIVARSAIVVAIARLFRHSLADGLTIAAARSPIGEFSFILGSLGVSMGILPPKGQDLIVAGALISIVLNSAVFWGVSPIERTITSWLARRKAASPEESGAAAPTGAAEGSQAAAEPGAADTGPSALEPSDAPGAACPANHAVVVGYGVAGKAIVRGLRERGQKVVLIDEAETRVEEARAGGTDAVLGNAAGEETLGLAHIGAARFLFVAIPEAFTAGAVVETARRLNSRLQIIVRAHSASEHTHFTGLGANGVVFGAEEIAKSMIEISSIEHISAEALGTSGGPGNLATGRSSPGP